MDPRAGEADFEAFKEAQGCERCALPPKTWTLFLKKTGFSLTKMGWFDKKRKRGLRELLVK